MRDRDDEAFELAGRAGRHRRGTAHHRERVGRRDLGPGSEVREQVTDGHHRRPRETHVLEDHLRVVLATAGQVRDQTVVGEGVGVDRLQLAMDPDRSRLERLVPLAQLVAPDLALPHLLGAREALRDLVLGCRMHRVVRESVHVLDLQRLEEHPVVRHELMRSTAERLGVHLREVPRDRTREMHRVQIPRTGAGRLVLIRRRTLCGHCGPSR